jgi:hypothetical protein
VVYDERAKKAVAGSVTGEPLERQRGDQHGRDASPTSATSQSAGGGASRSTPSLSMPSNATLNCGESSQIWVRINLIGIHTLLAGRPLPRDTCCMETIM